MLEGGDGVGCRFSVDCGAAGAQPGSPSQPPAFSGLPR